MDFNIIIRFPFRTAAVAGRLPDSEKYPDGEMAVESYA